MDLPKLSLGQKLFIRLPKPVRALWLQKTAKKGVVMINGKRRDEMVFTDFCKVMRCLPKGTYAEFLLPDGRVHFSIRMP